MILTLFMTIFKLSSNVVNKDKVNSERDNNKIKNLSTFSLLKKRNQADYSIFNVKNIFNF